MIKIAFDAQLLLKGNRTGIGWCADNLIKTIARTSDYKCQINYFSKGYSIDKENLMKEYSEYGIKNNQCSWFNDVWYKMLWPFLRVPYYWFFGKDCQITQFFNYIIPPGVKGKKVTIVHDMAHLSCPETVRLKTRLWLALTLRQSCKRADVIVTVSNFSKNEIIKYMNIPENKIVVMLSGVDLDFFHPNYCLNRIEVVLKKYRISKRYFLYLGTIEPRKNVQRIIDAYVMLKKKRNDVPQLVLAGGKGWMCDSIYENVMRLKMPKDIIFTGYIDEEEAPLLMCGAEVFLFPSLYEGFGTPPVEAMACGTPVISSKVASMPEIAGDAALLVNPYSVEEISEAMENLMDDEDLRLSLRKKGLERAKKYTWENSANVLKKIYQNLQKELL